MLPFQKTPSTRDALEQDLRRMESLRVLADSIAHDFADLLTEVRGNADFTPSETTREILVRGKALTQRLLAFGRGETPVRSAASLRIFLEEWVSFSLMGSTVPAVVDIAPDLWDCDCDIYQIGLAVNHVLTNARQASRPGEALRLRAFNLQQYGLFIGIQIENSGPSIPPEHHQKIFEPFFTTKKGSSGLGLAIAFSIVRQHEGWIDVSSQQGGDTNFTIYLPASSQARASTIAKLPRPFAFSGIALVMDDEEIVRDSVGDLLTRLGYQVVRANTGEEALEIDAELTQQGLSIQVFLLDDQVSRGMGGLATVQELKRRGCKARMILMSVPFQRGGSASAGGGQERLAKPFTSDELAGLLAAER